MKIPELLAPAGNMASLIAAIQNGADAVYFGGRMFSARQYADNFDNAGLEKAIDLAHLYGVKAYITVNTLVKDSEMKDAAGYIEFLCNAGADAVIVQDLGLINIISGSGLPVHASTQMTVHNIEGIRYLEGLGIKRVVLARELSLSEILEIKKETDAGLEVFIHGALCFSYSGRCLMSSVIGGRSGNRGYCAQPCRKKYRLVPCGLEGYLISPKDLCSASFLGKLIDAGIESFKIEGRMKRPEYVACVVGIYRRLIDRYIAGDFYVTDEEKHDLYQIFNRGFSDGYFFGKPGGEFISIESPYNRGTFLGEITGHGIGHGIGYTKGFADIRLHAPLRVGDGVGIAGGAGEAGEGTIVNLMKKGGKTVSEANSGEVVSIPFKQAPSRGEKVYKTYDSRLMESLKKSIEHNNNRRKIPVSLDFKARINEPMMLKIDDGENSVLATSDYKVQSAVGAPTSRDTITRQLEKLGDTIFTPRATNLECSDSIFIPVGEINMLRRKAVGELMEKRTGKWKRQCRNIFETDNRENRDNGKKNKNPRENKPLLAVSVVAENLKSAVAGGADIIYFSGGMPDPTVEFEEAINYCRSKGIKIYISVPAILKKGSGYFVDRIIRLRPDGILAGSIGTVFAAGGRTDIVCDYTFNVFNSESVKQLAKNNVMRVTLSTELSLDEIKAINKNDTINKNGIDKEIIIHGNFPVMVSEYDLMGNIGNISNAGNIGRKSGNCRALKDEKGYEFPVRTDEYGKTYIYNSKELCMAEYIPELIDTDVDVFRIEAKTFDPDYTMKVVSMYRKAIDDGMKGDCSMLGDKSRFTTGSFFRRVL